MEADAEQISDPRANPGIELAHMDVAVALNKEVWTCQFDTVTQWQNSLTEDARVWAQVAVVSL